MRGAFTGSINRQALGPGTSIALHRHETGVIMLSTIRAISISVILGLTVGCSGKVEFSGGGIVQKKVSCEDSDTCPPNYVTVNESYRVSNGTGKVDIMFVIDSTPPMFKTIT